MKTVVAAFLLAFLPCVKPGKSIVDGKIDVSLFANCGYKYLDADGIEKEGEVVEGECKFEIENRLRRTNLRRNLKSGGDAEFFMTFEKCKLKGDISGNDYTLIDGVLNFQEMDFEEERDVDGVTVEFDTIVRSIFDDVFLEDDLGNVVATGTKSTTVTMREDDVNEYVDSIDDLKLVWDVVLCDSPRLSTGSQGFIYENEQP
jgi:hypothetical protein